MKLHSNEDRKVIRHGTGEEQAFSIKNTVLAMDILSDHL